MGGESTTRTAPRSDGGTSSTGPVGSRTGQILSGAAVALGLVMFLGGFGWAALVYRPYTVPTSSMAPTIKAGERVLAQVVDGRDVRRGDVVVFTDKTWAENVPVVKRIVAVGGDKVSCCTDGKLTVNGKQIEEPYLPAGSLAEIKDFATVEVPEGRLFLLGDERQGSLDSTAHLTDAAGGTVARSSVQARVDAVVWPMEGMLGRPTGFETLGTLSQPGPLSTIGVLIVAGAVLVLGGGAYGPIAKLTGRRRAGARAGVRVPAEAGGAGVDGAGAAGSGAGGHSAGSPGPDSSGPGSRSVGSSVPGSSGGGLRKVARVVLLDPDDRVLLLHGHEPDDPADDWWFTPGGGLEGAETREEAALRELAEETGITDVDLGPVLWQRTCSFPFAGRRWDQDEWYYLARTTVTETGPTALTELERRSVAGARWWTCRELTRARETVYPTRLGELLRRLLDEGPPACPVTLETEIV